MKQYTFGFVYDSGVAVIGSGLYVYALNHIDAIRKFCTGGVLSIDASVVCVQAIELSV